ncbi:MAG TPA: hypothetical protein VM186_03210, partial [Planctomycetota bacterium]|nr:hypothetical protein [Planctomycetota bacterium]
MLQRILTVTLLSLVSYALAGEQSAPVPQLNTQTFWFANSFGGGKDNKWMQLGVQDIFVFPDGRVVTNTGWDEAGRAIGFYKNADVLGSVKDYTALTGGVQVTADDQFIFALRAERKKLESDPFWFGVARYTLDGQPAKWDGGEGRVGNVLFLNSPKEKSNEWQSLAGVALHNRELLLSEPLSRTIRVFATADMAAKREFKLMPETDTPGKMIVDKAGVLWIVQHDAGEGPFAKAGRIRAYSLDGKYQGREITDVEKPAALALDLAGRLLVCDGGKRQNIRRYDLAAKQPKLVDTFGQEGGVYGGKKPGEAAPDKFAGPTGVGVDAAGNTCVATNGPGGGAKLIAFDPKGKHLWTLEGLEFVDGADLDPADLTMAYTKDSAYKLDYAKRTGAGWQHAGWQHAAWTVDPFTYPNDPRLHVRQEGPKVFRRNGSLFLACSFGDAWTAIYRFDGYVAVPAAMFSKQPSRDFPPKNPITDRAWMWVDKNADGDFQADEFDAIAERSLGVFRAQFVDDDGTYWLGELNPAVV